MNDPNDFYQDDLDELLSQVDRLLLPQEPEEQEDDFDLEEYAPADHYDEPVVIQNYSNGYGAERRNDNPLPERPERTEPAVRRAVPRADETQVVPTIPAQSGPRAPVQPIPAYNADFRQGGHEALKPLEETRQIPVPASEETQVIPTIPAGSRMPERQVPTGEKTREPRTPVEKPKMQKQKKEKGRKKRPGCLGCGCTVLLGGAAALILAVVLLWGWIFAMPQSEESIGDRKRDTATVLICGTDKDGTRTDTMMLLYMSGSEKQIGLLSLPRDTYTITSAGYGAKLNSAYGRNGTGVEGMEGLLDYVQEIIGYRPDGYILVDMEMVPQIVDLMGGVDVEVPKSFTLEGVQLEAGYQHLSGEQVLQLLRYRKGYATQDLGRVEVQRAVISAALDQWVSIDRLALVPDALEMVKTNSLTNLDTRNFLWMGKTVLLNMGRMTNDTLPGYATYIGDVSYYVLYRQDVADLINQSYNPYREEILAENLKIAG